MVMKIKKVCRNIVWIWETFTVQISVEQNYLLKSQTVRFLLKSRGGPIPTTPLDLLSFILSYGGDVFPNIRIALQILLTIAVSIASCERSFSKLKLILSYLRASMGQQRLVDLAILSIERETLESTDFDDIIDKFASAKARKIKL